MSGNGRMKRVTDPLDDKVKARIIGAGTGGDQRELGYLSSGSEHSADADNDVVSPSFSCLVFYFRDDVENDKSNTELDEQMIESVDFDEDQLPELIFHQSDTDLFRNVLSSHVYKALEVFSCLKSNKSVLRRNVMMRLRDFGYNAAICKAKWESSGGLTAGNYEFIDVVRSDSFNRQTRYFVDLDFASEFEIARPANYYERLSQSLPKVFVGKSEELKQILRTMSDAARRSLKCRGLHLPPWRKHRFMQNKWLGPYKRTSNLIPTAVNTPALLLPPLKPANAVKCRSVGFEAAVNGGGLWLPAVTRTRWLYEDDNN
ncbi:hypothetical protein K7X08_023361 [Anisodus acutangulus]|uniref:DUF506 family protein n=1 Tax=Anisodus acutangulus TaxID=402998 RepID=A0A9Q1LG91_9SOLA|nr:hypothetical protein K7X08_023361 [Anisodus acutangulus]